MSLHVWVLPYITHTHIGTFKEGCLNSGRFGYAKRKFLIDAIIDKMPLILQKRVIMSFDGS